MSAFIVVVNVCVEMLIVILLTAELSVAICRERENVSLLVASKCDDLYRMHSTFV